MAVAGGADEKAERNEESMKEKKRIVVSISEEDCELLKREFGNISKGIEKLVAMYRRSLGPKSPTLRTLFNALHSHAEASGEISWTGAIEVVCRELGCDMQKALEKLQELFAEGYLTHSKRKGYVKVMQKRSI
jgi:hypothetical protein